MVWNEEKDLDNAVWVTQVTLFLQSFCFTIELLALLYMFKPFRINIPFYAPWKHKNYVVFWCFQGYKKLTLTSTDLILVVYRNYNVLQSFCFENCWLGK